MNIKIFTYAVAVNIFLHQASFSQDVHFSQFYQTPQLLNPALTGAFKGDQRVIINHKDQWHSLGSPYQTSLLSFDMGFFKKKWPNSYIGAGITVFKDIAGDTQLGTTQANISLSSIVAIKENHTLTLGLQSGFAQKSINTQKMLWASQFDGTTINSANASGETSSFEPYSFGDFSTGLSWSYGTEESSLFSSNEFKANAGIALFHVNRPKQQFSTFQNVDRMYSKLVAHGGTHVGIGNTNYAVLPSVYYIKQGPTTEIIYGAFVRYQIKAESKYTGHFKETALSLGGYSRVKDAFIPSILFEYAHFALGFTYDVNISNLREVSNKRGGLEVSLRFVNPNPFKAAVTKSVRFL